MHAFKIAIAAFLACLIGAPAFAGDLGGQRSSLVPLGEVVNPTWTGFHVSAGAGYGWQDTDISGSTGGISLDDALATIGVGWDYQMGNMVAGLMLDASFANLRTVYEDKNVADIDWQWYAGARLGFLAAPRVLVYGSVGYTSLEGGFDFSGISIHDAGRDRKISDIAGLTIGGGTEVMLDKNWSARLDYRHIYAGDDMVDIPKDGSIKPVEAETDVDQIRAMIVYKFPAH